MSSLPAICPTGAVFRARGRAPAVYRAELMLGRWRIVYRDTFSGVWEPLPGCPDYADRAAAECELLRIATVMDWQLIGAAHSPTGGWSR